MLNPELWLCIICGNLADPDLFDYCNDCDAKFSALMRDDNHV